ncbi:MAG: DegT/DnrJ/EryC1/StrS family aminotransferase [Enterobacterales bacterium]|nr:DegT/DnrJ/EryC1/StrS family aminotransferase [Enterobacterales bacterium]
MNSQTKLAAMTDRRIACLLPDLPSPKQLLPYLEQMHANRHYTNFGPLAQQFEHGLIHLIIANQQSNKDPKIAINACLCSSATSALEIAIAELALAEHSLVLLPALTFPATASAVMKNGLTPLISDVDSELWQLTPEIAYKMAEHYTIKAVIPVATFGQPVDIKAWEIFSQDTGIKVIVDAAGAFPFQPLSKSCPVVFSFHATKSFGIGEGGAIFLGDQERCKTYNRLSNFGFHKGMVDELGSNAKLSEYHAAVGLAQLKRWPALNKQRNDISRIYDNSLSEVTEVSTQTSNPCFEQRSLVPSLKVIQVKDNAAQIIEKMASYNIFCRQWYLPALNRHPLFAPFVATVDRAPSTSSNLPISDSFQQRLVGLPFHNFLRPRQIHHIVDCLSDCVYAFTSRK